MNVRKAARVTTVAGLVNESRYLIEFSRELLEKAERIREQSRTLASRLTALRTTDAKNNQTSSALSKAGFARMVDPTAFSHPKR